MAALKFYANRPTWTLALLLLGNLCGCAEPRSEEKGDSKKNKIAGNWKFGKCTLMGDVREFNDDAVAVQELPDATLYLVADGMGGIAKEGKVIGQLACEHAFAALTRELKQNLKKEMSTDDARDTVRRALVAANADVIALTKDPDLKNGGATIVLALFRQGHDGVLIAGIGDSRIYRVNDSKIEQLTVDHSLAQAMVENKTIKPEEAKNHRFSNVLWKFLGSKDVGDNPEVRHVPLQANDRLLLCTDGLYKSVPDALLFDKMSQTNTAQACADALGKMALQMGSRDNVSCIVIGQD